jgi:tetratricopeptide (TPR) repeat protein
VAPRTCPSRKRLDALSRGDLPPQEARPLLQHVDLCELCRDALRAFPRTRRQEPPGLVRLGELVASEAQLVLFASPGIDAALDPLLNLHRLTRLGAAEAQGIELGVTRCAGQVRLVVWAPGLDQIPLHDLEDASHSPSPTDPPRITLTPTEGLFTQELGGPAGSGPWLLDLGPAGPRIVDPQAVHLLPDPPDRAVLQAQQALSLGSPVCAGEMLRTYAQKLATGLKRRLAETALEDLSAPPRASSGSQPVGVVSTLVAWAGYGGILRVRALDREGRDQPGLSAPLVDALCEAGNLGFQRARQVLGQEPSSSIPPPPFLDLDLDELNLSGEGASVGLAAALARYSTTLGQPVSKDLLVTGVLALPSGRLDPVAPRLVAEKLRAAYRERGRVRVLLPRGNEQDVPADCGEALDLVYAETFAEATDVAHGKGHARLAGADEVTALLREAYDAERAYDWTMAIECAQRVLNNANASKSGLLRAHWLVGLCRVHQARPVESQPSFDAARALLVELEASGELEHDDAVYLALAQADQQADRFLFDAALSELEAAERKVSGKAIRAKFLGMRGLVLHYAGRNDEALGSLDRALQVAGPSGDRLDRGRLQCYRALTLTALERYAHADQAIEQGLELSTEPGVSAQASTNRIYLQRARARLKLAQGQWEQALQATTQALSAWKGGLRYPHSSLRRLQGRALLQLGRTKEGLADLVAASKLPPSSERSDFAKLLAGLPLLERAAWLIEHQGQGPAEETRRALSEARQRLAGYAPARDRFASQLESMNAPSPAAAKATRAVLRVLPY